MFAVFVTRYPAFQRHYQWFVPRRGFSQTSQLFNLYVNVHYLRIFLRNSINPTNRFLEGICQSPSSLKMVAALIDYYEQKTHTNLLQFCTTKTNFFCFYYFSFYRPIFPSSTALSVTCSPAWFCPNQTMAHWKRNWTTTWPSATCREPTGLWRK